jgi:hypothetical protein
VEKMECCFEQMVNCYSVYYLTFLHYCFKYIMDFIKAIKDMLIDFDTTLGSFDSHSVVNFS